MFDVVEQQSAALGFEPHLQFDGVIDAVPGPIAEHLLAVLREALANIGRHAHATEVDVVVAAGDEVVLTVIDNGIGIADSPAAGHGLRNMADRATQLGGTFRAAPADVSGSRLEFRVPNRVA
jgi:signal transduction histidine kinase